MRTDRIIGPISCFTFKDTQYAIDLSNIKYLTNGLTHVKYAHVQHEGEQNFLLKRSYQFFERMFRLTATLNMELSLE